MAIRLYQACTLMNGKTKFTYEQYWNERISRPKDNEVREKTTNEIFDTASSALKRGDRILDAGCGNGYFSLYIKDKFRKIYGAEIAKEAANIAQKQGTVLSIMDLNLSLSYKDSTFDAVACLEVLEHSLDPVYLLDEIYRIFGLMDN
ncbi:MAG: two-component response regulator [Candidatus Scalindua rubra]|uniref:Two-component response regulator n=1 Tax=Candidatus Scalindua rubra TaxID=1872076 RepID=A0A1E3X6M8_9BACT|nr:MAG: two-component response regulator [Candidatus Scalindua rubra]